MTTLSKPRTVQRHIPTRTRGYWQHNAPIQTELPHTQVKDIAGDVLPDMIWRRLPLWRHAITWHTPGLSTLTLD
ncbi:hypothetical protein [Williamsia sp.]|uniref:hypothetical protein n=1 Tax=Williamsia sp. TaxID=1872085 RepID=UPI002F9516D7